jgi:hypothetical protein
MQPVSATNPTFGATKSRHVQSVHPAHFGESPTQVVDQIIKKEAKEIKYAGQSRTRRMLEPAAWLASGALLAFGTAGLLHFIGFPLMAWGAYRAFKKW